MGLFFVFVDGLGLGPADPATNPVAGARLAALDGLFGPGALTRAGRPTGAGMPAAGSKAVVGPRGAVVAADATLGVSGLPHSATGQTSLFTGENGAAALGRHLRAYPTPVLRALLYRHSVFARLARAGRRVAFLNAFPPDYAARLEAGTARASATTLAFRAAGAPLRDLDELREGRAVGFDITGERLARLRGDWPTVTPAEAGRAAAAVVAESDVVLFEYFLTDLAGHAQDAAAAREALERLDAFVGAAVTALEGRGWLLMTSDHGNVEDLTVKTHTTNPVPVALAALGAPSGESAAALLEGVRTILDVAALVERLGAADGA